MKKVLAGIVALSATAMMIVGCGLLNPTNKDDVTITVESIDTITVTAAGNQTVVVEATLEGENEVATLDAISLTTAADLAVPTTQMDVTFSSPTTSGNKITTNITITVMPAACNGDYKLVIEGTSASETSTKTEEFTLKGHDCGAPTTDTALTSGTATLGAQGSANGSFLNADNMTAYLSAAATTNQADVDLQFGSYSSNPTFMSPAFSAANFTGSACASWTTKNATMFVKAASGTSIDNLDSLSEVRAIYDAGTPADHITIALNDVIVCMTSEGYPVAIGITTVSGTGTTMNLTVKGYHR